ncbi:MAG: 30S ribosomal protein S8 [Schleiferiaceae bacterium]|jgi:small subunit ribosomal protein S8|nr:30S ribosomal protein S8 [Flavobacteriales bacterium]MDA9256010.1 30S ribosomal protein S8 [Schleiferiaceae bacterium]MCO4748852.1 30S ribosomal protein S8 [Flavobacteriales bacterium]MDG1005643.1 30S ribosomal protein S8 [Schleiferiaceae bacterium]MDG1758122.1 30S ribosomal protein S8 [Schleiferiaceae bacterium]
MHSDPISDFLTRLRNGAQARHTVVELPSSNIKVEIAKILEEQGFIRGYKVDATGPQGTLKVALKYDSMTKQPVIRGLKRISRPGLRTYKNHNDLPRVKNGLGVAIVTTSQGVMTDKAARALSIGGEILCFVY